MLKKLVGFITCILVVAVSIYSVSGMINEVIYDEDTLYGYTAKQSIDADIVNIIQQVNESVIAGYLEGLVSFGPRLTGSKNCSDAADYIFDEFEKLGVDAYIDPWKYPRYSCQNVVATHYGTDTSSDAIIILCAHYDSYKNSPGANDDGSGIALMLTIANITSHLGFNHSLRFMASSGEEQGMFGSHYDAKQTYERNENIIAVLNIDTVGFVNTSFDGNIVQMPASDRSTWIVDFANDVSEKYEEYIDLRAQRTLQYPVDHGSYNEYGYDGVQIVQPKPELMQWMHTPNDTIDKINFTYLSKVTKLVLAMTYELANNPLDVQIRLTSPLEGRVYLGNLPISRTPEFNFAKTGVRGLTYLFGKAMAKVTITSHEEINSVYFGIDGYQLHVCNGPPYEWRIEKRTFLLPYRLKGYHRLTVCATTNTGNAAYDEMDLYIVPFL